MKILITVFVVFFAVLGGFAQNRVITGTVTDAKDSQPIPGVNVIVQGSTKGTATDLDGKYQLELASGENVLTFTFVGYATSTATVGDQTVIDIALESDTKTLNEVVVVGYGVQRKSDITGATASVKGEELSKQPVLTATQAMQGKIAGVQVIQSGQPGAQPQIRVRGLSTALAGTTALYVVDGVLTDDITNINTSDIVDMNILKDASAAAIYGSRGANGVVIITTRSGQSGKVKVNYNNNIGFRQAANLVQMADATEYANYRQAATGQITPPAQDKANTNWYKTILRNALEQSHNVSVSGGTDKSHFLFNTGYVNDQGIIINNNFKRLTMRLNSDYAVTDKIKLTIQASYANSINQNGFNVLDIDANGNVGGVYNDAYRAAPTIPSIVGNLYGNTSAYQNVGNPLLDIKDNAVKVNNNRIQGSTALDVKPFSWLTLRSQFGADWQSSWNRLYNYKFDQNDGSTFISSGGAQYNALSALQEKNTQTFRWVFNNTATFAKKFGNHDFTVLAGTTGEKYYQQWFSARRNSVLPDPNLWYIGTGDANTSQNDGGGDEWTRFSYLSRLNYSYAGKYLLTATFRRDGSSRFRQRWGNFPSIGAAWILTQEKFLMNQKMFDFLKLRASYGKVGNDQIPSNSYNLAVAQNKDYIFGGYNKLATPGAQINQILSSNLIWEVTQEYDVALEFGLIQSKLTGEVNYYHKTVNNALINVPVLSTVGNTAGNNVPGTVLTNAASIQNKGLEVVLNWQDQINENWSYTISGNVTFNKNTVLSLHGGQNIYDGAVGSQGFTTNTDVGHPVGSFYVLKTAGVFNSSADVASDPSTYHIGSKTPGNFKYQDSNHDGIVDQSDRVFVGSYQPVAYYGVNLGAKYKRLDFSVGIYGNAGNKVYNGKKGARTDTRDNIEKKLVYDRWTPQNLSQTQPAANGGNLPASTYFVESGSFIRINNLTIGYALSPDILERLSITNFRIFATSQNLFTFKKYSGFTAELPGGPTNSGIETSTYPTTRTVALGVNFGF